MNIHAKINGNTSTNTSKARRTTGAKNLSPRDQLVQLFDDCGKNKQTAIAKAIDAAEHSAALQEYLIQEGAKAVISGLIRSDNSIIYNDQPATDTPRFVRVPGVARKEPPIYGGAHKARLERRASSVLRLLDAVLPNGTLMADAKRADISHAVSVYEPQAIDMTHKTKYFKAVLRELPEGKAVSDVLDNAALTALYNTAKVA